MLILHSVLTIEIEILIFSIQKIDACFVVCCSWSCSNKVDRLPDKLLCCISRAGLVAEVQNPKGRFDLLNGLLVGLLLIDLLLGGSLLAGLLLACVLFAGLLFASLLLVRLLHVRLLCLLKLLLVGLHLVGLLLADLAYQRTLPETRPCSRALSVCQQRSILSANVLLLVHVVSNPSALDDENTLCCQMASRHCADPNR